MPFCRPRTAGSTARSRGRRCCCWPPFWQTPFIIPNILRATCFSRLAEALLLGLALTLWFPISKNRVSAPYVLLSLGLSGMLFAACHLLVEKFRLRLHLLVWWGRNPLVMYVLHMLLLGLMYIPGIPSWYEEAPLWLVLLQGTFILSVLTWTAQRLDRQKRYVSL